MIEVWHVKQFGNPCASFPEDYELVAIVIVFNVDEAFRLTNHLDRYWWLNPGVVRVGDKPYRSTSIGDVCVLTDGRKFLCVPFGWSEM